MQIQPLNSAWSAYSPPPAPVTFNHGSGCQCAQCQSLASEDTRISSDNAQTTQAVTPFSRDNQTATGQGNSDESRQAGTPTTSSGKPLSKGEQEQLTKLKARDTEVRQHEAAHMAASGGLAGSPTYSYQRGPDGSQYAVGGEVSINTSPGSTPQETISRARKIRAAALAPGDPSGQDRSVAAAATAMEAAAQAELAKSRGSSYGKNGQATPANAAPSGSQIDTYA